jgi:hypothetical protein
MQLWQKISGSWIGHPCFFYSNMQKICVSLH